MPVDDHIRIVGREQARRGGTAKLVAVADVNGQAAERQIETRLQRGFPRRIGVPKDRLNRRNRAQLVEDAASSHVTSVQDQLDAAKPIEHFRPH